MLTGGTVALDPYYARDRRVYDGALCSDMRHESDHAKALERRMKKANPTASCTYFPAEGKYLTFIYVEGKSWHEITGKFHTCRQLAMIEAIEVLEQNGGMPVRMK